MKASRANVFSFLTWPRVFSWYAAMLSLCLVGAIIHDRLYVSEAWLQWMRTREASFPLMWGVRIPPLLLDMGRASAGAIFALIAIHILEVIPAKASSRRIDGALRSFDKVVLSVTIVSALFFAYYVLPVNFYIECGRVLPKSIPLSLGEIFVSYFFYSFYVLGLWLGMAFPVLFFLFRGIAADWINWRQVIAKLENIENCVKKRAYLGSFEIKDYTEACNRRISLLRKTNKYYSSIFLLCFLLFLLEYSFFRGAATNASASIGKVALYLFFLTSFIISLVCVIQEWPIYGEMEEWLDAFPQPNSSQRVDIAVAKKEALENKQFSFQKNIVERLHIYVTLVFFPAIFMIGFYYKNDPRMLFDAFVNSIIPTEFESFVKFLVKIASPPKL